MEIIKLNKCLLELLTGTSNAEDHEENGNFPLFDRSSKIKNSNSYEFDGEYVLYPGEGIFIPKYYNGKFKLHQRVYALKGNEKLLTKYLYYLLITKQSYFETTAFGSTVKSLRRTHFDSLKFYLPTIEKQQEIIDIITKVEKNQTLTTKMLRAIMETSISDHKKLLKNLEIIDIIKPFEKKLKLNAKKQKQIHYLGQLITLKSSKSQKFSDSFKLNKGFNIPSNTFGKGNMPYIRVGSLLTRESVTVDHQRPNVFPDDLLVTFDGDPGRIGYGLFGIASSSIYKVENISSFNDNRNAFLDLLNSENKAIIKANTNGTTILHASKAKTNLLSFNYPINFKPFFKTLVFLKMENNEMTQMINLLLQKLVI